MKILRLLLPLLLFGATPTWAQHQKGVPAKVMTFNIRQENKSDGINNWEMRFQKVCKFLRSSKADIIGLQEVKKSQLDDIATELTLHAYVGVARDDGKEAGEYCPVFYNKEKFNLITSGTFWLSPNYVEPTKGWDAACKRIATWAILQDKLTMKSVIFLNTHLDHKGAEAQINGASLIKERLGRMSNGLPIIVTGDMNVNDESPVYAKFLTGIFQMNDVCKCAKKVSGPKHTFQGFGSVPDDKLSKIDYIFVTPSVTVKSAQIHESALGGGFFLSDHNAHSAVVVF